MPTIVLRATLRIFRPCDGLDIEQNSSDFYSLQSRAQIAARFWEIL